jgi:hypothetical protein
VKQVECNVTARLCGEELLVLISIECGVGKTLASADNGITGRSFEIRRARKEVEKRRTAVQ